MRKIKKSLFLLGIAGVFALTGCNGGGEQKESLQTEAKGADDKGKNGNEKAGITGDDTVMMAVGEEAVTYGEVLFYIYQLKQKYESSLGEEVWKAEIEEGKTFGEYAREEIIDQLTELKIICARAAKEEVSLSAEEISQIEREAQEYINSISEEGKKEYHISLELVKKVYQENVLAGKMFDITTSSVSTEVSDEEARQVRLYCIEIILEGIDKDGSQIKLDDKERIKAKKQAAELLKEWKAAEDKAAFAQANSQSEETEVVYGADNPPEVFGTEGLSLASKEFGEVIQGEDSIYLIYCEEDMDEDATREKKEEIIRKKQDEIFQKSYTEWSKNYKVVVSTPLWESIEL